MPSDWTDARIEEALDAWRWFPPGARRADGEGYVLAVTPGSFSLTCAYGVRGADGPEADRILEEIRERVLALGGTGVRLQVTPGSRPEDLPLRLEHAGYRRLEDADALAWELSDASGAVRLPEFPAPDGVAVREALAEPEYEAFVELSGPIFGDPEPPPATRAAFREEFRRQVGSTGHSDRYVGWEGDRPVARAGMEIVDGVARLWGTGVLESHRRRGIYGRTVRVRCEEAVRRGATLVLVVARAGSSGPILRRHGFRPVGLVHVFERRFGADAGA